MKISSRLKMLFFNLLFYTKFIYFLFFDLPISNLSTKNLKNLQDKAFFLLYLLQVCFIVLTQKLAIFYSLGKGKKYFKHFYRFYLFTTLDYCNIIVFESGKVTEETQKNIIFLF